MRIWAVKKKKNSYKNSKIPFPHGYCTATIFVFHSAGIQMRNLYLQQKQKHHDCVHN